MVFEAIAFGVIPPKQNKKIRRQLKKELTQSSSLQPGSKIRSSLISGKGETAITSQQLLGINKRRTKFNAIF